MTTTIGKTELIDRLAAATGSSKVDAGANLAAVLEVIGAALQADENVTIPGFGSFKVATRAARTGRNPSTGEAIKIAAAKVASFKAGTTLKTRVNTPLKKRK